MSLLTQLRAAGHGHRFLVMDNFVGRDVAQRLRSEALMLHRQGVALLLYFAPQHKLSRMTQ